MSTPSVNRIAELQQLIADFAGVLRLPHLADTGRPENDVEHSYSLALTAWFLAPQIAPHLDQSKILKYALSHDIVEIHAGDTFVFGPKEALDQKSDREDAALEQLESSWADFPELTAYAKGYKNKVDDEALFVYALDKLLPVLMVNLGEKDKFWTTHKITRTMQIEEKRSKMQASPYIAPYFEQLVAWMSDPDYFYKNDQDT